jgi:hypothetical protein
MRQVHTILVMGLLLGGCATKAMREQAGVMVHAGELLERETAAFAAARTGVVQLRQRSLVEDRATVATTGQQNAATIAQWKVAGTEERARRLALFEGVRTASEAMFEVRDQSLAWEESVLATRTALAVDRAALHRFVLQLVRLAQPTRFMNEVKFFAEYGAQVGEKVGGELQDVLAGVKAAETAAVAASDRPPTVPTNPPPGTPANPANPTDPTPGPIDPLPVDPTKPTDPTRPVGQPDPTVDPRPDPTGPGPSDRLKGPKTRRGDPKTLGEK